MLPEEGAEEAKFHRHPRGMQSARYEKGSERDLEVTCDAARSGV